MEKKEKNAFIRSWFFFIFNSDAFAIVELAPINVKVERFPIKYNFLDLSPIERIEFSPTSHVSESKKNATLKLRER